MFSNIIASIEPVKVKLVDFLKEINAIHWHLQKLNVTMEEFYNLLIRILEDKLQRIQLCITTLESANDKWLNYLQQITAAKRKDEEEKYEAITKGDQGTCRVLHEGKEAMITLSMHKDETNQRLKQLLQNFNKEKKKLNVSSNHTVNLPQLSLPTFSDPKQWR
uniref:Uncharacterized protein n=1 Tax=Wuchereria bancrofti TaxID=6293 RepID=A0AAF5PKV6_WUCBA